MPEGANILLEVDDIDVSYGHIVAVRNLSLQVGEGEIVALVGSNGAGKSTTLRAISALQKPSRGQIRLDGERIDVLRPEEIVARGVAHLPEGRGIFPSLSVEENLKMGYYTRRRDRGGWREGSERITTLFPRLQERWTQQAGTLSGGEQQMLALGRALITGPRLLMVDELSLGLAPVVVKQLFATVEQINTAGTTILLVEQYVNLALRVAARAYVLEKGRVQTEGSSADLLARSDVVRGSYLGAPKEPSSKEPSSKRPSSRREVASGAK